MNLAGPTADRGIGANTTSFQKGAAKTEEVEPSPQSKDFPETEKALSKAEAVYFYTRYRGDDGVTKTRRVALSGALYGDLMMEAKDNPEQFARTMFQLGDRIEIINGDSNVFSTTRAFLQRRLSNWEDLQPEVEASLAAETDGMSEEGRQDAYSRAIWTRVLEHAIPRAPKAGKGGGRNRESAWLRSISREALEAQLIKQEMKQTRDKLPGPKLYQMALQNIILSDPKLFQQFIGRRFADQPALQQELNPEAIPASDYSTFVLQVAERVKKYGHLLHGLVAQYLKAYPDVYRTYLRRLVDQVIYADFFPEQAEINAAGAIGQLEGRAMRRMFGRFAPKFDNSLSDFPELTSLVNRGLFWQLAGYQGPWEPPGMRILPPSAEPVAKLDDTRLPTVDDLPAMPLPNNVFGSFSPRPVLFQLNQAGLPVRTQPSKNGGALKRLKTRRQYQKFLIPQGVQLKPGRANPYPLALFDRMKQLRVFDSKGNATPYFSGPMLGRYFDLVADQLGRATDAAVHKFFESMLGLGVFIELQREDGSVAVGTVPGLFDALYSQREKIQWLRLYHVWLHQTRPLIETHLKQQTIQQKQFLRMLKAQVQ